MIPLHTYNCVKKNKRLWIEEVKTGKFVYTPPSWIKLQSRTPMQILAIQFCEKDGYDIQAVIDFEVLYGPKKRVPEGTLSSS